MDFEKAARRPNVFSTAGEDGVVDLLFEHITPTSRFSVEFGAYDGISGTPTRNRIVNHGWSGVLIEADSGLYEKAKASYEGYERATVLQSIITPDNIEDLFEQGGVPKDLDLLSLDIDSYDWHVWKAIVNYRPKVAIIEYNAVFPPPKRAVVPYEPEMTETALHNARTRWAESDDFFGASLQSFCDLADEKGYVLVYCTEDGCNAFFIDEAYSGIVHNRKPIKTLYRPPNYGLKNKSRHPLRRRRAPAHRKSPRWAGLIH